MSIWRPPEKIRVKVLGLIWNENRLLAAEVKQDDGVVKGIRPPGGTVEFGETREQALQREFEEELHCGTTILGPWIALENLFMHEGAVGHEYIFAAPVQLHDETYYQRDEIDLIENDQSVWTARWFDPYRLRDNIALYPHGLADQLSQTVSR
jgi:ADP-ribose pyrophosphatase YjhB (NUDIX family)